LSLSLSPIGNDNFCAISQINIAALAISTPLRGSRTSKFHDEAGLMCSDGFTAPTPAIQRIHRYADNPKSPQNEIRLLDSTPRRPTTSSCLPSFDSSTNLRTNTEQKSLSSEKPCVQSKNVTKSIGRRRRSSRSHVDFVVILMTHDI
jgi:hypothetical protein